MGHDYQSTVQELIENKYLASFEFDGQNDLEVWGFVLACNEELTLINKFSRESYSLNGYALFFNEDVSEYWVHTPDDNYLETKYIISAGIELIPPPKIDIENIESAMEAISSHFELLDIYRDDLEENEFTVIGSLSGLGEKSFGLLPLQPEGVWMNIPGFFRLEDVTRIDFGTRYLEVLLKVAGSRKGL